MNESLVIENYGSCPYCGVAVSLEVSLTVHIVQCYEYSELRMNVKCGMRGRAKYDLEKKPGLFSNDDLK